MHLCTHTCSYCKSCRDIVYAGPLSLDEFEDRKELLHVLLDHNL